MSDRIVKFFRYFAALGLFKLALGAPCFEANAHLRTLLSDKPPNDVLSYIQALDSPKSENLGSENHLAKQLTVQAEVSSEAISDKLEGFSGPYIFFKGVTSRIVPGEALKEAQKALEAQIFKKLCRDETLRSCTGTIIWDGDEFNKGGFTNEVFQAMKKYAALPNVKFVAFVREDQYVTGKNGWGKAYSKDFLPSWGEMLPHIHLVQATNIPTFTDGLTNQGVFDGTSLQNTACNVQEMTEGMNTKNPVFNDCNLRMYTAHGINAIKQFIKARKGTESIHVHFFGSGGVSENEYQYWQKRTPNNMHFYCYDVSRRETSKSASLVVGPFIQSDELSCRLRTPLASLTLNEAQQIQQGIDIIA